MNIFQYIGVQLNVSVSILLNGCRWGLKRVRVIRNFYVAFIFLYSLKNFLFIVDIISVPLILFNYNPASEKHSK
jgi:hypothetical protein